MTGPVSILSAPAKVNLHLAVGDLRADGYHAVTTVLTTLELADELRIRPASELQLACGADLGVEPERNLAYAAAVAMGLAFDRDPAIRIELDKRIPHGAGLGGGSSDAAAVIRALARLWGIPAEDPRPYAVAASLGADVPFFLDGGTMLLGGRGDEPLRSLPTPVMHVALVKPAAPVPTAAAYAAFDAAPVPPVSPEPLIAALETGDVAAVAGALENNLEQVASGLVPEVGDALAWLRGFAGVLGAQVAGSGSAVFALCGEESVAQEIAQEAASRGLWSAATRTRAEGFSDTDTSEAHA